MSLLVQRLLFLGIESSEFTNIETSYIIVSETYVPGVDILTENAEELNISVRTCNYIYMIYIYTHTYIYMIYVIFLLSCCPQPCFLPFHSNSLSKPASYQETPKNPILTFEASTEKSMAKSHRYLQHSSNVAIELLSP